MSFMGAIPADVELPIEVWLQSTLPYIAIGVGAAIAGAVLAGSLVEPVLARATGGDVEPT